MNKEQGFISIITTSIIMIILTLVVVGFSQVMQREQRQALDRQLSSQALYAAETGVNDLYAKLQSGTLTKEDKTTCDVSNWPTNGQNGVINPTSSNEAAYTCILYDQTPEYIEYNNGAVTTQQSKIFPIEPKTNNINDKVKSLTIKWSGARSNTNFTLPNSNNCASSALPSGATPGVPILRLDLVRLPKNTVINRDTTINETTHYFLYPKNGCGSSSTDYSSNTATVNKGQVIQVNCNNSNGYACTFEIDQMHIGPNASDRFYARLKSIYNDADVRIEGKTTAGGDDIEFLGAQVAVDVTGKSNDVLRRISVQIGNPGYPIPEFVAQGLDGVCKGITIAPPSEAPYDCY